jgi:hypothetical protein
MNKDSYEVVPGLWVGSKRSDLYRERQKLLSRLVNGDDGVKHHIKEITDELIEMSMPKTRKGYNK